MQTSHPAYVLGLFDTGIATVRILVKNRISVTAFDFNRQQPGFYSRFAKKVQCPHPENDNSLLEALKREAAASPLKPVLFPTSDDFVAFLSRNRVELAKRFLFLLPDAPTAEKILSKRLQSDFAEACGARIPRTLAVEPGQAAKMEMPFPLFLKPDNISRWRCTQKNKGLEIHSQGQLKRILAEVETEKLGVLLQEIIPGPIHNHFEVSAYIAATGKIYGPFLMQKLRQYPDPLGTGSYGKSIHNAEISQMAVALFRRMRLLGFVNAEFKLDARTQEYKYIETNIRVWQQVELAKACGLNLPLVQYLDLTNQEVPPSDSYREGLYWIDPLSDLFSRIRSKRGTEATAETWPAAMARSTVRGIFWRDDPLPFLRSYVTPRKIAALFYYAAIWPILKLMRRSPSE